MNKKETIRAAGRLLVQGNTTNEWARTKYGKVTGFNSPNACRFCLMGALARVVGKPDQDIGDIVYTKEFLQLKEKVIPMWIWDSLTRKQRLDYASKMANYNGRGRIEL